MGTSRPLLFSLLLLCLGTLAAAADPYFQSRCNTANYTANSTYETNLERVLSEFSTANFFYGFYNLSAGRNPNEANAIALCRGDVDQAACNSCLNESISALRQECPTQEEAVGWSEFCTVRYANRNIYGVMETSPGSCLLNVNNASNVDQFNSALSDLLSNLSRQAAAAGHIRKYASGNTTVSPLQRIYALMQCTPDLSEKQCSDCLSVAIDGIGGCCLGKVGCRVLRPSCFLRYESDSFFQDAAPLPQPPAPPPSPSPPSPTGGTGGDSSRTVVIAVVSSVAGVLVLIICICLFLRLRKPRKRVETNSDDIIRAESLQFDFATIRTATNNFSDANKLGEGGFGAVYKGQLADGQEVAVKRLSTNSGQGDTEFKNEVLLVAKLQHRNLVRLLGFCLEGSERLLIYEFVPNTSLDHFIFDPIKRAQLDWERRYKIIGGIARGILYLHEDSRLRIIHRDLKASNILLDGEMNPKIADFGMARLFIRDETQGNTSRIVGTYGYMAPEYAMHGQFSVKSDVYSFGVLLLEIVTGQKNSCFRNGENVDDLLSCAWKNWREGTAPRLIDPTLKDGSRSEMMRCIHIGLLCVQESIADRPTMASVVLMLNSHSVTLPVPSQPAFFMHSTLDSDISSSQDYNSWVSEPKPNDESLPLSKNEVSITELYPR